MFESKGIKRTIASVFAILAAAAPFIPPLAPFQEVIIQVAGALGVAGLGHAAVSRLVK